MLPILLVIGMLGAVMLAPLLAAGRSPHTLIRPGETQVGLEDLVPTHRNLLMIGD